MNEITKSCAAGVLIGAALLFGVEKTAKAEQGKSVWAADLTELRRLSVGGCGALTEHLLHAIADELIQGI